MPFSPCGPRTAGHRWWGATPGRRSSEEWSYTGLPVHVFQTLVLTTSGSRRVPHVVDDLATLPNTVHQIGGAREGQRDRRAVPTNEKVLSTYFMLVKVFSAVTS